MNKHSSNANDCRKIRFIACTWKGAFLRKQGRFLPYCGMHPLSLNDKSFFRLIASPAPSMAFRFLLFLFCICTLAQPATAQKTQKNPRLNIPDIPGYLTLKCDFHLHTVFSDGHVWPSLRVSEAERDGLDAISLTEHTDYEGYANDVQRDRERGYEIAAERAKNTHVLVIKGVEISPRVPPYHNNALFVKDLDAFPYDYMKISKGSFVMKDSISKEELLAPFIEAKKQGAFVFYNHPSYQWWDQKDKELFTPFHNEFLRWGLLGGVEVVNSNRYNLIAHRMAEKYNLTILANSDEHHAIDYPDGHRPMTLVFATEKTEAAIHDALKNRRTLAYYDNWLIGRQPEAEALLKASIAVTTEKIEAKHRPQLRVHFKNNSDIPYEVKCSTGYIVTNLPLGKIKLNPHESVSILLDPLWEYPKELTLDLTVENILVGPQETLQTQWKVAL